VLKVLAGEGYGADVVSAGEMNRALAAGVPAKDIVFSGVGKSAEEMVQALKAGIGQFNIESEEEGRELAAIAETLGYRATRCCASIPMSTRRPMPRFRPARRKTSSASACIRRRASMRGWRSAGP
jgi:diaminopimelate decarboxylase